VSALVYRVVKGEGPIILQGLVLLYLVAVFMRVGGGTLRAGACKVKEVRAIVWLVLGGERV